MSLFSNKALNLLNIHYGLRTLGWEISNLFSLAYLYKQGLSLPATFLVYGAMLFLRTLLRPLCLHLCAKKGIKYALTLGTLFFALRYLSMLPLNGINLYLIPFMLAAGASEAFYPLPYHFYFTFAGTSEQRGESVGTREAIATLIALVAPVLSGFLLAYSRPSVFILAAFTSLLAIIPLRGLPDLEKPILLPKQERKLVSKSGFWIFVGHGLFQQANNIWPVIIFMMLGENYREFGLILGLAAFFRVIGNLVFGNMIDKGKGKAVCVIGHLLFIAVACARGLYASNIYWVVLYDFFASISWCFYMPAIMTVIYNDLKKSHSPLYFDYYMELGWDVGGVGSMLIASALIFAGIDIRWTMAMIAVGMIWDLILLYPSYNVKKNETTDIKEAS